MLKRSLSHLLIFTLLFGLNSCNTAPEPTTEDGTELSDLEKEEVTDVAVEAAKPELDGTYGIRVGDVIAENDKLRKDVLQTGEGDFEIYYFDADDGQPALYVVEDLNDPTLVGDVHVIREGATVPGAKGIIVGDTWGALRKAFPKIEVFGSEIEGMTNAYSGNLSFRLDTYNSEYELEHSDINDTTKIIEIAFAGERD